MDVVLGLADSAILDSAYAAIKPEWDRENIYRQCISVSPYSHLTPTLCARHMLKQQPILPIPL